MTISISKKRKKNLLSANIRKKTNKSDNKSATKFQKARRTKTFQDQAPQITHTGPGGASSC